MSQQRFNENGYPVKECLECKQDININSFIGDVCFICHDMNHVEIWSITEGDYNYIYSKNIVKGTGKQIEKYIKSYFSEYDPDSIDDLGSDSIGYGVYNTDDSEVYLEYFVEAINTFAYNVDTDKVDIDLTKED